VGKPLSLHVEENNPAMGLYERLGFKKGALTGVYYFMERPAAKHLNKSKENQLNESTLEENRT